jgi:hypothetical protein
MNQHDAEVEKGVGHYEKPADYNVYGNQTAVAADVVDGAASAGEMQRGLKSRHIQFL